MKRTQIQPIPSCAYIISTPTLTAPQYWAGSGFTHPGDFGSAQRYSSPRQALELALTLLNDPTIYPNAAEGAYLCRYQFDARTVDDPVVEPVATLHGAPTAQLFSMMDRQWRAAFGHAFPAELLSELPPAGNAYLITADNGEYWSGEFWTAPLDEMRALRLATPLEAFQLARRLAEEQVDYLDGSPVFLAQIDLETDDVHRLFSSRLESNRPQLRNVWQRQFGEPLPEVEIFGSAMTPFGLQAENIPKFHLRSGCMKLLANGESPEGKTLFVNASVVDSLLEEREELRRLLEASTKRLREPDAPLDVQAVVDQSLGGCSQPLDDAEATLDSTSPALPDIRFEF